MVQLTIDGQKISVSETTTILEAARQLEIPIPTLCFHPKTGPFGACRLCLVELVEAGKIVTSCNTRVMKGLVVATDTPEVIKARKVNMELILARHPADCLTCDQGGDCTLQKASFQIGVAIGGGQPENRLVDLFGLHPQDIALDDTRAIIERDLNKCIRCTRCVNICRHVWGVGAIGLARRGFHLKMSTFFGRELECEFCGQCVDICPVGALIHRMSKYQARSWQLEEVDTICSYCSCGCSLTLRIKNNEIVKVAAQHHVGVNDGNLCYKGRYGQGFVTDPSRLTQPLIRNKSQNKLRPASWDEALDLVAAKLGEIKAKYGGMSIAGIGSVRCTNEENYLFQKLLRAALGTNHIDNSSRLEHAPSMAVLGDALGWGAMTNPMADIARSKVILIIGANLTETHPVFGAQIRRAAREGKTKLILVEPRKTRLSRLAEHWLKVRPGQDVALLLGLMQVIVEEGLEDRQTIEHHTSGYQEFKQHLKKYTPAYVSQLTDIPAEQIIEAGRLFGAHKPAAIVYGMGLTQHVGAQEAIEAVADLALLTGNLGKDGGGIAPLRGQCNNQGTCDMGVLPDVLPGYQKVDSPEGRRTFEDIWETELPDQPGLPMTKFWEAIRAGQIRALYIMGENPVLACPSPDKVKENLKKLDFLVVQDIFLSETAELADVVLPGASFAEKDGTFTNMERRVQKIHQGIDPVGQSLPDWEILIKLSQRLGYNMDYISPFQVMEEIREVAPIYGGMNYNRLEREGLCWPCPDLEHPGTPRLYQDGLPVGKARFRLIEPRAAIAPTPEYPYLFLTGKLLLHYHAGRLTKFPEKLVGVSQAGIAEFNPQDAAKLNIKDGDKVRLRSPYGGVTLSAQLSEQSPPGIIFIPVHFAEAPVNMLLNPHLDEGSSIPELKMGIVNVEKIT